MNNQLFYRFKFFSSKLVQTCALFALVMLMLLGGSSLAQHTFSYIPSAEEIAKYGPGFPDYCSAYPARTECVAIYAYAIPVEPDPCYQTGAYQPGCVPTQQPTQPLNQPRGQQYHCLVGDPSPNCYPLLPIPTILPPGCVAAGGGLMSCEQPPVGYPQPYPVPLPVPLPPPPPSVYEFRYPTPPPTANCQYGYSPHCLAIAPMKAFDHSYAVSPAITSYRIGESLQFRINSPYTGYLYVFVEESDGRLKTLYPNAYTGGATYIQAGTVLDLPSSNAQYSLDVTAPYGLHKLFFVVASNALAQYSLDSINYQSDLDTLLLNAGLNQGTYHGYAETAFDVVY